MGQHNHHPGHHHGHPSLRHHDPTDHKSAHAQDSHNHHHQHKHQTVQRSASTSSHRPNCTPGHDSPGCTYPTNDSATLPILLGIFIPLTVALVVLLFLHRRNKRRQRVEDANDKHASLDFGLGEVSRATAAQKGRGRRTKKGDPQPEMMDLNAEREFRQGRGMSMDMGSPYVLPGELQESRPSFHSLSRSAHDSDDPYSPVAMVRSRTGSSPGSQVPSRAPSRKDSASMWTESSDGTGRNLLRHANTPPPLGSSLPPYHIPNPDTPNMPSPAEIPPLPTEMPPPIVDMPPSSVDPPQPAVSVSRKPLPDPAFASVEAYDDHEEPHPEEPLEKSAPRISLPPRNSLRADSHRDFDFEIPANDNINNNFPTIQITESEDYPAAEPQHREESNARLPEEPAPQSGRRPISSVGPYDEYTTYADVLGIVQKETTDPDMQYPPPEEEQQLHGLGVYGLEQDNRRLSSSLRPLPPDDPSDNPEARANRIRSFYREYFDESKTAGGGWGGSVDYYEDYGQEYLNGATMYDPETGQFIMSGGAPYAEPIMRRAMTPPPRAPPRFGGPGSAGHRHYGSDHFGWGGPRPRGYSSASGTGFRKRGPKRPVAPPAPLTNLPTPYLLKDDAAIFTAIDFAPPSSYRERAAGRPESPFADQKPYSPSVRAFTPLASPFEELSAMPSPHHLRKSGTFTALDFAPPPRLKTDGGSDSGSIRSGRSNMSATQLANIRAGAYRVSRLPKDFVGTRDEFAQALRPTWDQRGPTS